MRGNWPRACRSGCDTPTVFNFVEEALDQVACAVKISAEAQRLCPISFRWDIGPSAVLAIKGSDPVRVIAAVGALSAPFPSESAYHFLARINGTDLFSRADAQSVALRLEESHLVLAREKLVP